MGDTLNGLTLEQHERRCKQGIYPPPMVPVVLALVGRVRELKEAMRSALNELGVPSGDYPAPVANVIDILKAASGEEQE